ncbi:MAG: tetratricopeptide repeat protein [Candidatus Lokiarchaeota archaeon]|nr:tetratricopeptide repeat protein [Candidatus Lokiarchaeota archaeon]
MSRVKHNDLIQAEKMADEGDFKEALEQVNAFEKKNDLNNYDQISCYILKSSLLINLSQFEEGFKFAEKAYQMSKELRLDIYSVNALILMGNALVRLQKLDDALDIILQGERLLKSRTQISQNELMQREASLAVVKSIIFFYKGDGDNALKYMKQSLTLRETLGNKKEIIESLGYIGNVYTFYKCDLDLGLKAAERCQALVEEVNVKSVRFPLALNLINFGNIYFQKGLLDRALKYYKDSLSILEELKDNEYRAAALANISNVYLEQGKIEQFLETYKKVLKVQEKIGNPWYISIAFLNLIQTLVEIGDIPPAKNYLEQFQRFNSQVKNDFANASYRFCLALVLKTSSRTHNRAKSEELLKQIIEEQISTHFNLGALIHLCDLFLIELRITNDLEILDDLQPYIDQLLDFAEKNQSYTILCETYLLQARIALLTFDIKKTRRLLIQAHQIAKRHDLRRLAGIILDEHEELINQLHTWKRLKKMEAPISERIELSQLNNQIRRIIRKGLSVSTQISEETVTVHKDKKVCLVCKGEALGFTYICKCDAIYCENCARALSDLENVCWVCNTPIDRSKPVKSFFLDKEEFELKKSDKKLK